MYHVSQSSLTVADIKVLGGIPPHIPLVLVKPDGSLETLPDTYVLTFEHPGCSVKRRPDIVGG
jgi:hypothetical protein